MTSHRGSAPRRTRTRALAALAGCMAAAALALPLRALGAEPAAAPARKAAPAGGLTPLEQAGRKVFFDGVSAQGRPIKALVGPHDTPVDGSTLPCASCHGPDGLGRPEGVVQPPSIVWSELAKPYGHRHPNGRQHPAYTEASFAETLTSGKDPAGHKLDAAMPRYVMANDDIKALAAYLKRIQSDFDPGLAAERIRLGTLLPTKGRLGELGVAMQAVLRTRVDLLNAKGGLFGRKVDLVVAEYDDDRAATLRNAEKLFADEPVFAFVSPVTVGLEKEFGALAERHRVPVVGPFTLRTRSDQAVNRQTFFVLPGLAEQVRVLSEFATRQISLKDPAVAVVHPDEDELRDVAQAAVEGFRQRGWQRSLAVHFPPGRMAARDMVGKLQQAGVQVVLFLGNDGEFKALSEAIRDAIWTPYVLAPGVRVGRAAAAVPTTLGERVFLSYPTQPGDVTKEGAAALGAFQRQAGGAQHHQPAMVSAYAAMQVLEEGLKRSGRELSRAKLVQSLENLFSFETTVTPALSYGPKRRIGALGGYVVAVDPTAHAFKPVGSYIRIE